MTFLITKQNMYSVLKGKKQVFLFSVEAKYNA